MRVGRARSKRERQHQRIVPPLPGMLVIALAKADLTKAEPLVEGQSGGVVAAHLKQKALCPSLLGGVPQRQDEPAGNPLPALSLAHAEGEDLRLVGGEPPEDEADGLGWGCHPRQERLSAGMLQQPPKARLIPARGEKSSVQVRKLPGVLWRSSQERHIHGIERRDHGGTRRRQGSAGGFTSGGLR